MRTSTLTVVLVSVLLLAGAGTAGALTAAGPLQAQESPTGTTDTGATDTAPSGQDGAPSVTFNDQESSGESILVQSATLPENGFIAIYDSSRSGNATNQIVGASYPLSAGTSDNIRIQFDQPVSESKSLTAVVHTDSNGNDQFDYVSSNGQQDPPLMQGDRRIVDIAQVDVQGGGSGGATDAGAGDTTDADSGTQAAGDGGASGGTAAEGGANDSGGGEGGASSDNGPGFGLIGAVVALLAAALLVARRN